MIICAILKHFLSFSLKSFCFTVVYFHETSDLISVWEYSLDRRSKLQSDQPVPYLVPYSVSYGGICHLEVKNIHKNQKKELHAARTYDFLCGGATKISSSQGFTLRLLKYFMPTLRSLLIRFWTPDSEETSTKQTIPPETRISKPFRQFSDYFHT